MEGQKIDDLGPMFNFQLGQELKDQNTQHEELFDEDSSDSFVKQDNVMCYSNKGSHRFNEDKFDFIQGDSYIIGAVYDGHGGSTVSLYLKNNLLHSVVQHERFQTDPTFAIKECLQIIEKEVTSQFDPNCGSTVLVVLWKKGKVIVVSLGDGSCYGYKSVMSETKTDLILVSERDEDKNKKDNFHKVLLNEVHNLENENQRKRVRSLGGSLFKIRNSYRVNGELNVSRSIGDLKYKKWISAQASVKCYEQSFQYILIASDGFSKKLQNLSSPQSIQNIVHHLPYFKDNATFILIRKLQIFDD